MKHISVEKIQRACSGMGPIAYAEYTKQSGGAILAEDRSRISFVADELRPDPHSVLEKMSGIKWGDNFGIDEQGNEWLRTGVQVNAKNKTTESFCSFRDKHLHERITFESNEKHSEKWTKLVFQEFGEYRGGYKRLVAWVTTTDKLWHDVQDEYQTRIRSRVMGVRKPRFRKNIS